MGTYAIPAAGYYTMRPAVFLGTKHVTALYAVGCRKDRMPNPASGYGLLIPTQKGPTPSTSHALCQRLTSGTLQLARVEAIGAARGRAAVLCRAVARGKTTVWEAIERIERIDDEKASGIEEAKEVRSDGELVEKFLNPRSAIDLMRMVTRLSETITRDASKTIKPLLRTALQGWADDNKADFKSLSPTQIDELWKTGRGVIHTAVDKGIGLAAPGYQQKINFQIANLHRSSQKFLQETYLPRTQISFLQVDQVTLDQIGDQAGWWMRDGSGQISSKISNQGRAVIQDGVKNGLGRAVIAKRLISEVPGMWQKYGYNYARTVAAASMSRARSYSEAASYTEAGISYLEVMAMLDERTTDICRGMDGMVIEVKQTMAHIQAGAAVPSPTDISKVSPFMQELTNKQTGLREIWIGGRGGTKFAEVMRSGKGNVDDRGSMKRFIGGKDLPKQGISAPPYHYN